jgi:hypothetical protein
MTVFSTIRIRPGAAATVTQLQRVFAVPPTAVP